MSKYLMIHPDDNVMVLLEDGKKDATINGIKLLSDIPKAHKVAVKDILEQEDVIKYGNPIGHATELIKKGAHVHTHNVATNLGDVLSYTYEPEFNNVVVDEPIRNVMVYERENGDIGIRNELWIIPTVGCINGQAHQIAKTFMASKEVSESFDGIFVFGHPFGCSQMGDDLINTKETLQNIALHPNAGGVLILGLGCENNQVEAFKSSYAYNPNRTKFLTMQDVSDEILSATDLLEELYQNMSKDQRKEVPISRLNIGLKCGGSDGFSGITGNPLLGKLSDYITFHGGTTLLTEVPEMFGAEKILMKRAQNKEVFEKTVALINDFKAYYRSHHQVIYDNPSPGNKQGGITTLEDKSLGCTQKGGTSIVTDVLKHTERLKTRGLNLISAPGNDLISVTTLGMAGCHMVLFTTGRGTPFGGFIPTLKVSTNTELYQKKQNWIDYNAGQLVDGKSMDETLKGLIDLIVDVASGKKISNEKNNFREIAIFKDGVTL